MTKEGSAPTERIDRDIYRNPCQSIPELAGIGHTEITLALPHQDIESEPGCLDIYLACKGEKYLFSEGQKYQILPGDFFLTPPGKTHNTGNLPISKCAHYWLRIDLSRARPFLGSWHLEPLKRQLRELDTIKGEASEECFDYIRRIHYSLSQESDQDHLDMEVQLLLGIFLLKLLESVDQQGETPTNPRIGRVIQFMNNHLCENLSVSELAAEAGYSPSAFRNLFRREVGISPKEYFLRRKLEAAKDKLKNSEEPITQISLDLGFSSSQYFSTSFKRYNFLSPQEFRKRARQINPVGHHDNLLVESSANLLTG